MIPALYWRIFFLLSASFSLECRKQIPLASTVFHVLLLQKPIIRFKIYFIGRKKNPRSQWRWIKFMNMKLDKFQSFFVEKPSLNHGSKMLRYFIGIINALWHIFFRLCSHVYEPFLRINWIKIDARNECQRYIYKMFNR